MRSGLDILVVGGGTFGSALGTLLCGQGHRVRLWVRRKEQAEEINSKHTNSRYLGDFQLHEKLEATTDMAGSIRISPIVLVVVPSKYFRSVASDIGDTLEGDQILVHATKGIEIDTFKRMSDILREETCALKIGVISGPNLSKEILAGQPAGALVASRYDEVDERVQTLFAGGRMRLYSGRDVIGTEIGGSFKNIIALASGMVDGMGLGDNTRALLITRGLSEMARFGVALGADVFTFGGLAGIGDLMATCASPLSRNHQVGERLAKGEKLDHIVSSMNQVAEGVTTTKAVHNQAQQMGLDLPIVRAVHGILYEDWSDQQALENLMAIPVGRELAALRYK
jgi:glycerol-3-phosphate dehydrogenase (NAD(P)+)